MIYTKSNLNQIPISHSYTLHFLFSFLLLPVQQITIYRKPISRNMKSAYGVTLFLLFLLFSAYVFNYNEATSVVQLTGSSEMFPLVEENMVNMMMFNESRRKLGSFQICAVCTCCGGAKGVCLPSPCCYAINCNIPNRPFGFCSFTPKTCNCFGCHL
ncbi:hypothetical protein CRYUN_Cryun08bG0067000 [Craigia yunnanensis]